MSTLQCPACKQNIDSDSLYCDQCGEQIMVCSVCGRAGKGKRCIYDGKEMVIPGTSPSSPATPTPAPQAPVSAPVSAPVHAPTAPAATPTFTLPPTAAPAAVPASAVPATSNKIKLTSQSHGIVIEAQAGDVLGRTKGNFAAILGRFSTISGSHCQIIKPNNVWSIMDLGSTNCTFYNGAKLTPNAPVPVQSGGKIKVADIEFVVSFDAPADGTQRICD